jgi:hypothetical protein
MPGSWEVSKLTWYRIYGPPQDEVENTMGYHELVSDLAF